MAFRLNSPVIINKHQDCDMVIIPRLIKNQLHPKYGLYCSNHCSLIKWLGDDEYPSLKKIGVEELDMLPDERAQYDRRLRLLSKSK